MEESCTLDILSQFFCNSVKDSKFWIIKCKLYGRILSSLNRVLHQIFSDILRLVNQRTRYIACNLLDLLNKCNTYKKIKNFYTLFKQKFIVANLFTIMAYVQYNLLIYIVDKPRCSLYCS